MQGGMRARDYEMHAQCALHMISRDRDHSEEWGWGSTAVWNLSKNSSDLVAPPFPQSDSQILSLVITYIFIEIGSYQEIFLSWAIQLCYQSRGDASWRFL